jgi:ADP-ribosylglycohydrolase
MKDKFLGTILGVAVGDALGMPFETMTHEEIALRKGKVRKFYTARVNPHPYPEAKRFLAGEWTDDTQLTLAVADALIESGGIFNMKAHVQQHILAYKNRQGRGWGRSTRNACARLEQGVPWEQSGEPQGVGNGVLMKIAPLGLLQAMRLVRGDIFTVHCAMLGKMTHGDPAAVVAGCAHAEAIHLLALSKGRIQKDFLSRVLLAASHAEGYLQARNGEISNIIRSLRDADFKCLTIREIAKRFGNGTKEAFRAGNSFGIAYTMFLRNPENFQAVYDTIEVGGDTDSNASIVASLLGALHGEAVLPARLLPDLERVTMLRDRAEKLYAVATERKR